jgi:thymidylate synthase
MRQWTGDGFIGKAYGYQLGFRHKYPEGEFDQVDRVLYDLKHNPYSRRIIVNLHYLYLYPISIVSLKSAISFSLQHIIKSAFENVLNFSLPLSVM